MKRFLLLFTIIGSALFAQEKPNVAVMDYDELKSEIYKTDDMLYLVNFWATWCKPCVEELPEFLKIDEEYKNNPHFKLVLVSLDMAKLKDKVLIPYLEKNNISANVILLDDAKRMNEWIPAFDASWSGAIPATILLKNNKKLFFIENSLDYNTLKQLTETHL